MTSKKPKITMDSPREAVELWRGLGFNVIPALTRDKIVKIVLDTISAT